MTKVLDGNICKGWSLNYSQLSDTDLDYECSESLLAPENDKFETQTTVPNSSEVCPPPAAKSIMSEELPTKVVLLTQQTSAAVMAQIQPNVKDFNRSYHVSEASDNLDLQRMADKFTRAKLGKLKNYERTVFEANGFNYGVVTRADKLLEEAYNMLHIFQKKLDYTSREKLLHLILALNELPHLHNSTHREKGKLSRVTDWLINDTSQPEPEMRDFTLEEPVQIRKFIADIQPRMSTSDSNVIRGKRKCHCQDSEKVDMNSVQKSSSDARIDLNADWSSSKAKRRRLGKN